MKKPPRKTKHWAEESYKALGAAWALLIEEYPNPSEIEKLGIINYGPALAALNRGIDNKKSVSAAYSFTMNRAAEDMRKI